MRRASSERSRHRASVAPFAAALVVLAGCTIPFDTGLGGPKQPVTVQRSAAAGVAAYELGNPEDGEALFEEAEEASDRDPSEKPYLATTLTNIAIEQTNRGNNEDAIELHERALRLRQEAYGTSHPEVAESLNFLGAAYYQAQRYDEAEAAFRRAVAIRKEKLGPDSRLTGLSMNNLAFFYAGVGKYEQADPLFVESIRIIDAAPDASWAEKSRALDNYVAMLLDAGRADEASELEKRAAQYRTKRKQMEDILEMTR